MEHKKWNVNIKIENIFVIKMTQIQNKTFGNTFLFIVMNGKLKILSF
jgi:hypothetical protein